MTIEAAKGRLAYESARDVSTSEWDGGYTYSTVDDAWELAADPNRQKTAALQLEVADQNLIAEFEWRVLTAESVEFRFDVEPPHPLGITWRLGKEGKSGHLLLDVGDKKQGGSSGEAGVSDLKPYQALRGEWMKIRWMIIDDTVRVEAADVTLTGQHMASGKLKTRIVFAVVGGAAQIRNLKIWEVKIEK